MNAVAKTEIGRFQDGYRQLAPNIAKSLPNHISPERFERATMVAVQRNPDLVNKADRRSLFLALQRSAADGLLPDGREGAIVLFGNQATWMPMVAGLMKLARNSGEIASINAHVAYEGEKFRVILGDEERIEHEREISLVGNSRPIAVYAVAKLKDGEIIREVLTAGEVEKIRNVSRAKSSGPWVQWADEMWKKSAIRRLSKRLPLSTDRPEDARLQRAIEAQDNIIEGQADPIDAATEAAGALSAPSKLDAIEGTIAEDDAIPALEEEQPAAPTPAPEEDRVAASARRLIGRFVSAADIDAYNDIMADSAVAEGRKRIAAKRPELDADIERARAAALDRISKAEAA